MPVVNPHCAGLDVHKKTVVACLITPKKKGGWEKEIRTFSTLTKDWLNLSDWLTSKESLKVLPNKVFRFIQPALLQPAQYRRLSARRGKKRAAVAVAHSILVIADHLTSRQQPYRDLGTDYFDEQRPESGKNVWLNV
ncbi:MAG UNVERIFIED_CONTAM: hypothetical protein LVR29_20325 [Microcystis novacekii LVE1205-3]|jgi:hypothetical protein